MEPGIGGRIMNEAEVRRFIQYYERLTRWMLETVPDQADICVTLDDDHGIAGMDYA